MATYQELTQQDRLLAARDLLHQLAALNDKRFCCEVDHPNGINILDSAVAHPIIVLDYDANWPGLFQSLRKRIADALGDIAAAIEHVGSTAVPELAAKPIIDIDVLLASETMLSAAIERLAGLGYTGTGNHGMNLVRIFGIVISLDDAAMEAAVWSNLLTTRICGPHKQSLLFFAMAVQENGGMLREVSSQLSHPALRLMGAADEMMLAIAGDAPKPK